MIIGSTEILAFNVLQQKILSFQSRPIPILIFWNFFSFFFGILKDVRNRNTFKNNSKVEVMVNACLSFLVQWAALETQLIYRTKRTG
jgi:hypothetical protein